MVGIVRTRSEAMEFRFSKVEKDSALLSWWLRSNSSITNAIYTCIFQDFFVTVLNTVFVYKVLRLSLHKRKSYIGHPFPAIAQHVEEDIWTKEG
jgi:hypothetical protein